MATSDAGDSAEPPPLYPTQLPAPALLRYALHHNGHAGEAVLAWRHDGQAYHLALDGSTPAGAPLLAQASNGLVDANGLAPQRFVDRRRSGAQQAANFRRDIGRIGYSGPAQQHPAWPGAQDRLSALVQLAAVLAADPGLAEVQLFVADARGTAAPWRLVRQGDAPDTAGAIGARPWWPADLQLWQREPLRPEGLRVQVWMAALADTAAGRWPLRLRYTALRSGDVLELNLLAPPQPLP